MQRMTQTDFGTKTGFPLQDQSMYARQFSSDVAMPLMKMKSEQGPKLVYVTTPTAHFNAMDGQYLPDRMDDEKKQCVDRVTHTNYKG